MALVSIITIVKDHALGLRETVSSVAEQEHNDWEMLIVVGASKDSTLQTAREIATKDFRIKVIEQSGLGIYGAMNEGIQNAVGEFSWFMNAGDKFTDARVLAAAVDEITRAKVGLVIGGYRIDGGNKKQVYSYPKKEITALDFAFQRRDGRHQAMIFRTENLRQIGKYDLAYPFASDFDLVIKVIKLTRATRVPEIYATIEPGGVADQNIFSVHREKHQIRKAVFRGNLSVIALSWAWTIAARMKITLRRLLQRTK